MYYALFVEIRRRHFNPGSFCRKSVHTAKSVLGNICWGEVNLKGKDAAEVIPLFLRGTS